MKEKYEDPKLEIISLRDADIITTSGTPGENEGGCIECGEDF